MKKKEISAEHYKWLTLSIIEKYEDAKSDYFEKFPKGSIQDFHSMEIEHWETRLKNHRKFPNNEDAGEWFEVKFIIEARKMLDYYKGITNVKKTDIPGRAIALFCSILLQSGLMPKGMDSNESYCEKVFQKFKIPAPKKTRQYFSENMDLIKNDRYLRVVIAKILPKIPSQDREKILSYLDSRKLHA